MCGRRSGGLACKVLGAPRPRQHFRNAIRPSDGAIPSAAVPLEALVLVDHRDVVVGGEGGARALRVEENGEVDGAARPLGALPAAVSQDRRLILRSTLLRCLEPAGDHDFFGEVGAPLVVLDAARNFERESEQRVFGLGVIVAVR